MRRRFEIGVIFLLLLTALALAGCSSRRIDLTQSTDQMDFGVRMAKTNLWREALFRFERAVEIDPGNPMALNNLAVAYEGIGEFEKARDAYARALQLDKSNQHIQKNYSRFVEFYSRNRKREIKADVPVETTASVDEPDTPSQTPIEISSPEEPPKPGDIPVSQLPPNPTPPLPATPPATTTPPGGAQ